MNTAMHDDVRIVSRHEAADGSVKYAFADHAGNYFEAINFQYEDTRGPSPVLVNTICLSSQVGCAMACSFCATGHGGFVGHLTTDQLFAQATLVQQDLSESGRPAATAVALMGMGEPLMNYHHVVGFFERVLASGAASKIGLSTVGVTPRVEQLAGRDDLPCNLTVSFHSPYDEERARIIPITSTYPLAGLVEACRRYAERKSRLVRASYLLFGGVNDSDAHARDLCRLLDPEHFEIKILLFNPIAEASYTRPPFERAERFRDVVRELGFAAHIDVSRGRDVAGGCGQLARRLGETDGRAVAPRQSPSEHPGRRLRTVSTRTAVKDH